MEVKDIIKGFEITKITNVKEINAIAYQMSHIKTKAQLIWLKRNDDNKTFAITFKTLPSDSTGVFHILEHSVLNGSEKYPLKEPFVDLLKGSLQTFLNAMTYPDKTVYPVASRNNQDFKNLVRVYLDGVFHPLAKKNPFIFNQEGWHYHIENENDPIQYKGVVYSEMKGAFSSPERLCPELLQTYLFADNSYGYISGGDPDHIPELTYQQFCQTHDRFYNPSNSYIWLDGDLDIEEMLGLIDEEYLSEFTSSNEEISFTYQKPSVKPVVIQDYELEENAQQHNKSFISKGYVIGDYNDIEKILALNIVGSILTANNQSPLKRALLENELAQDIDIGVNDGILQPYLEIDIYNTNPEYYEEIENRIQSVLQTIVKEGLNKDEISAQLNMLEFSTKERDFGTAPKGLVFCLQALNSWLYSGDPLKPLVFDEVFKDLREKISTDYYEQLISEIVLNSKHSASVLLKPNKQLQKKKQQELSAKLSSYRDSLTSEQLVQLVQFNQQLALWQAKEDTPEVKAMLPCLSLSDVNEEPSKIQYQVRKQQGIDCICYDNDTNGIDYYNLFFNIDDKTKEELQKIALLLKLMPELPSEKYDVTTFSRLRKSYIGSTSVGIHIPTKKNKKDYDVYIGVNYSCLQANNEKSLELIDELLYNLRFDDQNVILEVLKQEKASQEMMISARGNSIGISRVSATLSEASAVNEYINGLEYYNFLKEVIEHFSQEIVDDLQRVYRNLFTTNRLTISAMGQSKDCMIEEIIAKIKKDTGKIIPATKPLLKKKQEGIAVASSVAYAQLGCLAKEDLQLIEGNLLVANKILSLDYLWTNIRAISGAYGCGVASKNGCLLFYSYRDPNPANSLKVYRNASKYLKALCEADFNLTQYIIGTIGDTEPLLTNSTMMMIGNSEYFTNVGYSEKCQIRKSILSTTKQDLLRIAEMFDKSLEDYCVCVVGGRQSLEEIGLDTIHEL